MPNGRHRSVQAGTLLPRLLSGLRTLLLVLPGCTVAAVACNLQDPPCFCSKTLKGTWLADATTIRPLCRRMVSYKGVSRIVDIYLPRKLSPKQQIRYTPWIYLHGVHAAKWYIADNPVWESLSKTCQVPLGGNAQVSDLNVITGSPILSPCGSQSSKNSSSGRVNAKQQGHLKMDDVLLVVLHATGSVQSGQVWNSRFWRCVSSLSYCVDESVDDVWFLALLISNIQKSLFPGLRLNKPYLAGYSNGGMLVQSLLCEQPSITSQLSGVGVLASTLGRDFATNECQQQLSAPVPFLWVHGSDDDVLPYQEGKSEGVDVMGVGATVQMWAERLGCPAASVNKPQTIFQDPKAKVTCVDYCTTEQQAPREQQHQQEGQGQPRRPVVMCSITGGSHSLTRDVPAVGYAAGLLRWGMQGFAGTPVPFA